MLNLFIDLFNQTLETIQDSLKYVDDEQAHWRPSDDQWSILEVINHLYDEEREDFRRRLDLILNYPGLPWPPIDPQKWVVERDYNSRNIQDSLNRFMDERDKSINWLKTIQNPNWDNEYEFPNIGVIKAGDLLASWLAHDYLHVAQISRIKAGYVGVLSKGYSTKYAML